MINEGKSLDELLNISEEEKTQTNENIKESKHVARNEAKKEPTKPLNADIPESLMRDLKMLSVHNDTTIKDIVCSELSRYVKREKKKMIESLSE